MEHKELKRIIENANTAILFIHGIVGTPNHFNEFIKLVPEHISIHNLLLDGHGKGVKDFSKTSMKKWENQIETALESLAKTHKEIYIVAHSMGTLFAIQQAIKNEKVAKLFLLAIPIKLCIKPKMISNTMKVYFNKIKPDDLVATAAKNCYGIKDDKNIFNYLGWVPRYLELFSKIFHTRQLLGCLNTPSTIFQSSKDEMISNKSSKILRRYTAFSVYELKNSGHYYYDRNDFSELLSSFQKWCSNI